MIHRSPRRVTYTPIDNKILHNTALSWKARGLLCYLLSLPDDWEVSFADLVRQSQHDGETALRAAFKELQNHGFVRLVVRRSEDNLRAIGRRYDVSEDGFPASEETSTSVPPQKPRKPQLQETSTSGNLNFRKPELQETCTIIKDLEETKNLEKKTTAIAVEDARVFSRACLPEVLHNTVLHDSARESTQAKRTRRLSRCPPEYMPSPSVYQWAAAKYPEIDVLHALEAMRDWEFKTTRSDWDAVLRTWIRNEAKHQHGGSRIEPTQPHQNGRISAKGFRSVQAAKRIMEEMHPHVEYNVTPGPKLL